MPRSSNRLHDRRSFFKYTSAATAKLVLNNRTLRWSSPSLFNDPFDIFTARTNEIFNSLWSYFKSLETSIVENPLIFASSLGRVATAFKILLMYLEKTFWPFNLCSDYSYNQIPVLKNLADGSALAGLTILILSVVAIFVFWRRQPIIAWAGSIFVLSFLIIGNILFPTGTIAGERLMYYPSLGLTIILGYLLTWLTEIKTRKSVKIMSLILITAPLIFYVWQSHRRSLDWLTEKQLFISAALCAPNSVLSRSNLGAMYYQTGDIEKAEAELVLAEKIYGGYPKGLNNLGLVYWKKGEKERARTYFLKALDFKFPYPGAYENLALLALESDQIEEARKWLILFYSGDKLAAETYIQKQMTPTSY